MPASKNGLHPLTFRIGQKSRIKKLLAAESLPSTMQWNPLIAKYSRTPTVEGENCFEKTSQMSVQCVQYNYTCHVEDDIGAN